jgi:hypothetical protein
LREEVAFIAAELGWGYDEILAMPHRERIQWVKTLSQINRQR